VCLSVSIRTSSAARRCERKPPCVHKFPESQLAANLAHQPTRTPESGDQTPHRRCWNVPQPGNARATHYGGADGTTWWMGCHQLEVIGRERPEGAQPTRRPRRGGNAATKHHLKYEDRPTRGTGNYATPRGDIMNYETIRYELARECSSVSATFEATFFVVDLRIPDKVGRYMVL